MKKSLLKNYIGGRSCSLLGLGVSNLPLCEYLIRSGVSVTVRDKKTPKELGETALGLQENGVGFICGEDCFDTVNECLIFRSPGVRPDAAGLPQAAAGGAEILTEIELFMALTDAQTYGITGSDGKTTTTTLTGRFLSEDSEIRGRGQTFVGGNIGEPLLYKLDTMTEDDRAAIELSSFQLMSVKKAPAYSAITNISPNHLDWHRGMDEYIAAKRNIVGENTLRFVTNAECAETARLARDIARQDSRPDIYLFSSKRSSFYDIFDFPAGKGDRALYLRDGYIVISDGAAETRLLDISKIRVPGIHNVENFMTAIGLTYGSVDPSVYGTVAESFFGVEHRLELIRELRGVRYYNSSIDSSPTRTAAALSALDGEDIVIICGGYDKKIPYEPLAEALCRHVRAVVLTGATAPKIEEALLRCPDYTEGRPEYVCIPDFESAVRAASSMARVGGCVLLSPASASFDAFPNFAVRGNTFRKIVTEL